MQIPAGRTLPSRAVRAQPLAVHPHQPRGRAAGHVVVTQRAIGDASTAACQRRMRRIGLGTLLDTLHAKVFNATPVDRLACARW